MTSKKFYTKCRTIASKLTATNLAHFCVQVTNSNKTSPNNTTKEKTTGVISLLPFATNELFLKAFLLYMCSKILRRASILVSVVLFNL